MFLHKKCPVSVFCLTAFFGCGKNVKPGDIDGYDEGQRLTREQVYDLKAIPALYLLDAEKRVILKDASFEQVEERLS
jgi:hypothetical protein